MRSLLFLLLGALPGFAACHGPNEFDSLPEDTRAALHAQVEADPYGRHIIWQAEKPGSVVHVVGTMHFADPRHETTLTLIKPMLAEADLLMLEVQQKDQKALEARLARTPNLAFLTEGPSLIDRLTPQEWAMISDELSKRGMPPFMAAKYQPWFLGMALAIPPCAMADIVARKHGLDQLLEEEATLMGTPISTLDDVDALLNMLAGDPIDKQVHDLKLALSIDGFGQDLTTTSVEMYFRGEHQLIWAFTSLRALQMAGAHRDEVADLLDEMASELMDERNSRWAPKITEAAKDQRVVVAVGALHLGRESGVLRTLEQAGYTLSPVPITFP